ncbi:prolyl oligopeptidase family serine peptidase [Flaviramulus sp. BrNp1-15]|uniref:carboxylesterase family protein n=1 Tax=Flaviramulus sp. BrNp1-15 TaxID=2916754 RepID=UPI001EE93106|nr:prolyl oligopeptidase family serine peptidase [Flaviramulus sp. BrNp1-15]ULC60482.1 prolyl oligopeptidase family serine peptidase [Flaviramulus sp. BrNp1-15]
MKSIKFNLIVVLVTLCCITNLHAQSSLFSYEQYVNTKGDTLKYRQLVSDYAKDTKYPLVIFLHGSGERGDDNKAQLKWGVKNFATSENMKLHPTIVIAPQCPKNTSWGNYSYENMSLQPEPTKTMTLLIELIHKAIENLPVDTNRIYITGLSMGGFGTFDAVSRYPDLFAAAVPVCGGGDVTKAESIAHIPMWIFHGAKDDAVNAVLSQNMLNALTKAGSYPGYTQYPEVGHFSWIAAYSDTMMMEWLFNQRKQ